jgi:hypothetical protein
MDIVVKVNFTKLLALDRYLLPDGCLRLFLLKVLERIDELVNVV